MITREEALERAIEYLGRRFSGRLDALEGWPDEAQRAELRKLGDELRHEATGMLRRVWRVRIPPDTLHVGADRFLILDGESGAVVRIMDCGE